MMNKITWPRYFSVRVTSILDIESNKYVTYEYSYKLIIIGVSFNIIKNHIRKCALSIYTKYVIITVLYCKGWDFLKNILRVFIH